MILERGDLQFFFQPTVQAADALEVPIAVQSLFAILSPSRGAHRRMRIGKKRLPTNPRERFWARIERVGSLERVLGEKLEDETYGTKTRGTRFQPGARPVARGTYEFVQHDDHVHFVYDVEPFAFEDAPDELHVPAHGDHRVLVKGGKKTWTQAKDLAGIDERGFQLVLIGSERVALADRG